MSNRTDKYKKVDQKQHVLLRPDMYIGSVSTESSIEYISSNLESIEQEKIDINPGICRIFIEALSNAVDNVERSKKSKNLCKNIKIEINETTGLTSVWNDGEVIPIEIHSEENCYVHTMIFGQLLTGENYNDDEERLVSGRNGLGVKLVALFSSEFTVEGVDPKNQKKLIQKWTKNMGETSGPVVTNSVLKSGYTKVSWIPDFPRFRMKKYTSDIINLYRRYCIDAAMLTGVSVFFNNELIKVKNLSDYAQLYEKPEIEPSSDDEEEIDMTNNDMPFIRIFDTHGGEVVVTPSPKDEFQAISFVNGIYTKNNGKHVDVWVEALLRPLVEKFNGKDKKQSGPKVTINDVKQFFRFFVSSKLDKPKFESQEKSRLVEPIPILGEIKKQTITTLTKWAKANIENLIRFKDMTSLQKLTKTKRQTVSIEGYDPANNTTTKNSYECTLIVCEGLSAKTLAVAGLENELYGKSGRSWFGVLPLRGKCLNTRNATALSITKNKVITSLIKALRVQFNMDYTVDENFKTLGYGRVMIMADADCDGIHIEGLILNFFHSLYPSLLQRKDPFVVSMRTPIVRIFNGKKADTLFYDETRFNQWIKEKDSGKIKLKYYKGLGTTKPEDVNEIYGKKLVEYTYDDNSTKNMDKVFSKKYANDRKKWLANYQKDKTEFSLDDQSSLCKLSLSEFLDYDMIKFSHADCARSIPSFIDGLKESQRKILYCVKKRNLKYSVESLKVQQLGGYTAEHSNYHHGEQNLYDTIISMASDFIGTNNIPLLYRDGMFGTRLSGGDDAASARYIYTKMDALTELIYKSEDESLLTSVIDDGDKVQPEYYVPIIPMILINGTKGIGTGWSSSVPCYNPLDVISLIEIWIENEGSIFYPDEDDELTCLLPDITPWYRDFHGNIEKIKKDTYMTTGVCNVVGKTINVTELPIGMWTDKFKEICENLIETKKIKSFKNFSTPKKVHFEIIQGEKYESEKDLHIYSYIHTSNMVLFDENNKLYKFDNINEIIDNFCILRLEYYEKRKKQSLQDLRKELQHTENRRRFIGEVIEKTLDIMYRPENDIISDLTEKKYDLDPYKSNYDYLLSMQVRTFTKERYEKLKDESEKLKSQISNLEKLSPSEIWLEELGVLKATYTKWLADTSKDTVKAEKPKSKK